MPEFVLREPECVNLAGENTGRDHLSHSGLSTLLGCQQRWFWHYEQRMRPAVTKTSLALGRAFAEALDAGDPDHAYHVVTADAEREREAAAGSPWVLLPAAEDVEVGAQIAREAARCYLGHYGTHDGTRELEMRARIRNPAERGRYSLSHDLLGRVDAADLENAVMVEDKLVGQVNRATLASRLRLDRQVSIGCYLIWRTTGVEVREVQYRVTVKPAIRRRQGESHDDYLVRIAHEYATRPEHYMVCEPVTRTTEDYLRLEQELWRWAETVRDARRDGVWPRNTGACMDFGGCQFLALCSREPGAELQYRQQPVHEFVERTQEVAV
jgi:PD-(D/E)XK nuclease superfamily